MVAKDMTKKLKEYEDFRNSKTILCELIENMGHMCTFIPKFPSFIVSLILSNGFGVKQKYTHDHMLMEA